MFRKSRKVQQAIEPGKEGQAKKSRFQIVKLEERIAPRHSRGHYYPGNPHGGSCHYNPQGTRVGNC